MNKKTLQYGLVGIACLLLAYGIWKYRQPNFGAGDPASDFEVELLDGKHAKLSDLRGKYVLLQFWGSWCGPCRMENPHLVQLYKKYHDKGFEIFSVAIDANESSCSNAILRDQMSWPYHTLESYDFGGPVSKLYNIKSIPATFLINPQGIIMGVNLRPEYINKMLSEKLL